MPSKGLSNTFIALSLDAVYWSCFAVGFFPFPWHKIVPFTGEKGDYIGHFSDYILNISHQIGDQNTSRQLS